MQNTLKPYLHFKDNARQAMEFYESIFGGTLTLNTFKESHASSGPTEDDKIMHAMLEADNGITFMAADTPSQMEYTPGASISMSLTGDNHQVLSDYFAKLCEDGTIAVPLDKAPWGDTFGMCTDKFGIVWMVNISNS